MAYTFILNEDNSLVASRREVIMQRSKLVDDVWFLINPTYKLNDMSIFSVTLEYILPTSKRYETLELIQDQEGYEEYLKYVVPLDTNFSSEAGDIEMQLTLVFVGLDENGKDIQKVRKTKVGKLHITKIAAWSDIVPDGALSALDQRIIATQAQIKELGYYAEVISENQVDNLKYDDVADTLQLMAGEKEIGDKVNLGNVLDDGIPAITFGSTSNNPDDDGDDDSSNVVQF